MGMMMSGSLLPHVRMFTRNFPNTLPAFVDDVLPGPALIDRGAAPVGYTDDGRAEDMDERS